MPSPADELRQVLRGLEPAFRQADLVLSIRAQAVAAITAADAVALLESRRRELGEAVEALDAKIAARADEDDQSRNLRLSAIEKDVEDAKRTADEIKARVGREARDFIDQTEQQRAGVSAALAQAQENLRATRAVNQQADQDRRRVSAEFDAEMAGRRTRAETEIGNLEAKVAALRKEYREIQDRLSALTAASR